MQRRNHKGPPETVPGRHNAQMRVIDLPYTFDIIRFPALIILHAENRLGIHRISSEIIRIAVYIHRENHIIYSQRDAVGTFEIIPQSEVIVIGTVFPLAEHAVRRGIVGIFFSIIFFLHALTAFRDQAFIPVAIHQLNTNKFDNVRIRHTRTEKRRKNTCEFARRNHKRFRLIRCVFSASARGQHSHKKQQNQKHRNPFFHSLFPPQYSLVVSTQSQNRTDETAFISPVSVPPRRCPLPRNALRSGSSFRCRPSWPAR